MFLIRLWCVLSVEFYIYLLLVTSAFGKWNQFTSLLHDFWVFSCSFRHFRLWCLVKRVECYRVMTSSDQQTVRVSCSAGCERPWRHFKSPPPTARLPWRVLAPSLHGPPMRDELSVDPTVRAGVISTIFGNRRPGDVHSQRDERSAVRRPCRTVIRRVNERRAVRIGLFNTKKVANKSASICRWIAESNLSIAALVDTWHDYASSPPLIACDPPGFKYVERARRENVRERALSLQSTFTT